MDPDRRDLWLRSHVATDLERDVRQILNISDLRVFNQFLNLAATPHSQAFHPADLSRELRITQPTVKSSAGFSRHLTWRIACHLGAATMANAR